MEKNKKVLMLLGNYDSTTHRGIARAAKELKWHLNVSMLISFQIPSHWEGDGIICKLNGNKDLEAFVMKQNLPTVDLSSWRSDLQLPRISADNKRIGQLSAEHFCSYGHRSFAWFCHLQNPVAEARYRAFKEELLKLGHAAPAKLTGKRAQDNKEVERWLAKLGTPTALFAYNDNDAAWLMNTCLGAGFKVPDDFAILGVDNNLLICEHMPVSLSSINHNHEKIGYKGAQLLNRIMEGETPSQEIQYIPPTGITLRNSTDSHAVDDSFVREAINFMLSNLNYSIGTSEIASELGISRRNLEMRFRKALQTSVHKKLMELRLRKSVSLLTNTDQKIEDIAAVCGFSHGPHMCHAFKKAFQQSPLAFRKEKDIPQ